MDPPHDLGKVPGHQEGALLQAMHHAQLGRQQNSDVAILQLLACRSRQNHKLEISQAKPLAGLNGVALRHYILL